MLRNGGRAHPVILPLDGTAQLPVGEETPRMAAPHPPRPALAEQTAAQIGFTLRRGWRGGSIRSGRCRTVLCPTGLRRRSCAARGGISRGVLPWAALTLSAPSLNSRSP